MVTVASAQPHAGPGGRIISLSTRSWGLAAVYRMYPRVERVDLSPSHSSSNIYVRPRRISPSPPPSRMYLDSGRFYRFHPRANPRKRQLPTLPPFSVAQSESRLRRNHRAPFLLLLCFLPFLRNQPIYIFVPPSFRIRIRLGKIVNSDFWRGTEGIFSKVDLL